MLTPVDRYIRSIRCFTETKPGRGRPRGSRICIPSEIDWGRPYHEIAADLGVSIPTVRFEFLRRHPGARKHIRIIPKPEKLEWQKYKLWDWSKRNSALAKEHGVTRERVRQIREALSIPKYQYKGIDWSCVDWNRPTERIAQELSVSQQCVEYRRKKVGSPYIKPDRIAEAVSKLTEDDWKLTRSEQVEKLKQIDPRANQYWIQRHIDQNPHLKRPSRRDAKERYGKVKWGEMTSGEISKIVGVSPAAVVLYAKNHGFKVKRSARDGTITKYSKVDWTLSNREIANQTGSKINAVCEARWRRFGRWK